MIAFLFPGQGSQSVGMGQGLVDSYPVCRQTFEEADDALGEPLSRLILGGPAERLMLTEHTQPAIVTVSVAAARLLASQGLHPDIVAGHSLGEYSAHVSAGTFGFADALRVVRNRGRYMQEAVPIGQGAMAAVLGLSPELVTQACVEAAQDEVVSPANFNAPGQVVIAGAVNAVARAAERAQAFGARRVVALPVSAPFHCALMKSAEARLTPELRALPIKNPRVPVVANVDAALKTTGPDALDALIAQVSQPVRWEDVVRRLASTGVTAYVEAGPGAVLSGLGRKIVRDVPFLTFGDPKQLAAIASLFVGRAAGSVG